MMKYLTWMIVLFLLIGSASAVTLSLFGWDIRLFEPSVQAVETVEILRLFGDSITAENDNYLISCEQNEQGYGPDGQYHIFCDIQSKGQNRVVDFAVVSPVPLQSGSQAGVEYDVNLSYNQELSYTCAGSSPSYGWIVNGESFYCNTTYQDADPFGNIHTFNVSEVVMISSEFLLDLSNHPDNATVTWNETRTQIEKRKVDLTSQFGKRTVDQLESSYPGFTNWDAARQYGNYTYILLDNTMRNNTLYTLHLTVDVEDQYLPMKYSLVFFDRVSDTLFVLDPTLQADSRTWTSTDDFNNNTVLTNLTSTGNEIGVSAPVDPTDHVLVYTFDDDETDGTVSQDLVNDYNCTITSATTGLTGKFGEAYDYDGSDDRCVYTASGTELDPGTGAWSISVWFNTTTNLGIGDVAYLFDIEDEPNADNIRCFTVDYGAGDFLRCDVQSESTNCEKEIASSWNDGAWHHLVLKQEGTLCADVAMYIDNSKQSLSTRTSSGTTFDLDFEELEIADNDISAYKWHGNLDEFYLYHRNITADEVTYLYTHPYSALYSQGIYQDVQGWLPPTGNKFTNISVEVDTVTGSTTQIRFNSTNSSVNTSAWQTLSTDGTNVVTFDTIEFGEDDDIFLEFMHQTNGVDEPLITSYTLNSEEVPPTANGTLYVNWTEPTAADNHTQYTWKEFSVNVSCRDNDCGNVTAYLDPEGEVRINYTVSQVSDDGWETTTGVSVTNALLARIDHTDEWMGYRFQNVTIPQGAIIVSAVLDGAQRNNDDGDEPLHRFWGEDSENPSVFSTALNNFSARVRTSSSYLWNHTDMGCGVDQRYSACAPDLPNLTAVVQELVNTYDYSNGNTSLIILMNGSTASRDLLYGLFAIQNSSLTPTLEINYTTPANDSKIIIPTTPGSTPFWTNTSNPWQCGVMANGTNCSITWWVNATGDVGTSWEFYVFTNSSFSNMTQANSTRFNISIQPPADSCTYEGSGTWNIDCQDNCVLTTDTNLYQQGISINGSGLIIWNASITNFSRLHVQSDNLCRVVQYQ